MVRAAVIVVLACAACAHDTYRMWTRPDGKVVRVGRATDQHVAQLDDVCGDERGLCGCESDSDCDERPGGVCDFGCGAHPSTCQTTCVYDACTTNAQCGAGEICVPEGELGFATSRCVRAICRANTDCTSGSGGGCRLLETVWGEPVAACVYADGPCDPEGRYCSRGRCSVTADDRVRCVERELPP